MEAVTQNTTKKTMEVIAKIVKQDGTTKTVSERRKSMSGKIYVQSTTKPGKFHVVYRSSILGRLACTCEDFRFRRSRGQTEDCKHITMIKEMINNGKK